MDFLFILGTTIPLVKRGKRFCDVVESEGEELCKCNRVVEAKGSGEVFLYRGRVTDYRVVFL